MGYGDEQIADLQATIEATPCDVVVSATPIDITRVLKVSKPMVRVGYELAEQQPGVLARQVEAALGAAVGAR
jgi:predicted GTPase